MARHGKHRGKRGGVKNNDSSPKTVDALRSTTGSSDQAADAPLRGDLPSIHAYSDDDIAIPNNLLESRRQDGRRHEWLKLLLPPAIASLLPLLWVIPHDLIHDKGAVNDSVLIHQSITSLRSALLDLAADKASPRIQSLVTEQLRSVAQLKIQPAPEVMGAVFESLGTTVAQLQEHKASAPRMFFDDASADMATLQASSYSKDSYWKLAAALINYRSADTARFSAVSPKPSCFSRPHSGEAPYAEFHLSVPKSDAETIGLLSNCSIDLSDVAGYKGSELEKGTLAVVAEHPPGTPVTVIYLLDGVDVTIRDGRLLPLISEYRFANCRFNVRFTGIPPARTRTMTELLLAYGGKSTYAIRLPSRG